MVGGQVARHVASSTTSGSSVQAHTTVATLSGPIDHVAASGPASNGHGCGMKTALGSKATINAPVSGTGHRRRVRPAIAQMPPTASTHVPSRAAPASAEAGSRPPCSSRPATAATSSTATVAHSTATVTVCRMGEPNNVAGQTSTLPATSTSSNRPAAWDHAAGVGSSGPVDPMVTSHANVAQTMMQGTSSRRRLTVARRRRRRSDRFRRRGVDPPAQTIGRGGQAEPVCGPPWLPAASRGPGRTPR